MEAQAFGSRIVKFPVAVLPHVCAPIRTGKDGVGHDLAVCSRRQTFDRCSGTLPSLVSVLCVIPVQALPGTL